ncbi:MAG: hypothetical protein CO022_02360 [Flavobacteriales bacterium CG_4_9_14_0_2_um_filter_32_27]|nr:MAG: hypothetical protein CO022_02360 [Flavobacteriales bacterium CG_4_9_14_0_2_um_filter_32_27]
MTTKEFIIERLDLIIEYFPNLKCIYEYDEMSKVHLIKVLPQGEFDSNKKYSEFESEIIFDFICRYNDSNILFFTTDGSPLHIKNPIYQAVGKKFESESESISSYSFENFNKTILVMDAGENNYAMAA